MGGRGKGEGGRVKGEGGRGKGEDWRAFAEFDIRKNERKKAGGSDVPLFLRWDEIGSVASVV